VKKKRHENASKWEEAGKGLKFIEIWEIYEIGTWVLLERLFMCSRGASIISRNFKTEI
jgi:hypothetical protein